MPQLILNVDDREINRYVRTRVLQQAGYRVVEAGTGQSAIEIFLAKAPRLVLLDMNLPDMTGMDVCRRIRSLDPEGKVVIVQISAISTRMWDQVEGLEGGAHAYLVEPVAPALLVATVRSLLGLGAGAKPVDNDGEAVRKAHSEYLRASREFDDFAATVRDRSHGMQHPDGVQAIANLGKQRASAFAKYRDAFASYTNATRARADSSQGEGADGVQDSRSDLTAREREVLTLIAAGQTTKEVAYTLGITFKTAACHRNRILSKFSAHNTAEVVRRAISEGLIAL